MAVDNVPPLFPPGDHRKSIDLKDLSELSGIANPTLRDWLRRGTIPGAFQRKQSAKWRFRREMLEPWWDELLSRHNFATSTKKPKNTGQPTQNETLDKARELQEKDAEIQGLKARLAKFDSEDLGLTFIKPYPTPTEMARRLKQDQ
jgi:phage terminase Nu1 subunit (DNA packaging protein)